MSQKGTHTWDLIIQYHRCPHCGYIFESREDYEHQSGEWVKNVACPRCQHPFQLKRKQKPHWAPIFGR